MGTSNGIVSTTLHAISDVSFLLFKSKFFAIIFICDIDLFCELDLPVHVTLI